MLTGLRTRKAVANQSAFGMISTVNARTETSTKANWNSSHGPALRTEQGGGTVLKKNQTTTVASLRLNSVVTKKSFTSTGDRHSGGHVAAQMLA
jgi:hypothetical protein